MMTKKDVINEILRKVRILTQMKYGESDDKLIKKLLAEDLALLSEIENKHGGKNGVFIENAV